MLLIFCVDCTDVVRLVKEEPRTCKCGKIAGQYAPDGYDVVVSEGSVVLGIAGEDLLRKAKQSIEEPMSQWGIRLEANIMPPSANINIQSTTPPGDMV